MTRRAGARPPASSKKLRGFGPWQSSIEKAGLGRVRAREDPDGLGPRGVCRAECAHGRLSDPPAGTRLPATTCECVQGQLPPRVSWGPP